MITAKYKKWTSTLLVHTGPCLVTGFWAYGSAIGGCVFLYDGIDASGEMVRRAEPEEGKAIEYEFSVPLEFKTGIYVKIDVTGCWGIVEFII